jgi:hypothetical protein
LVSCRSGLATRVMLPESSGRHAAWPWLPDAPPGRASEVGDWPRITVVTPSLNQGEFIEETIRSVVLQGYPNLEYIIMDGGSDDGTVDIIRRYEKYLADWCSERDRGQSHAINKGWRRATGEIVAWLNSDDYYVPGTLFRVASAFSAAGGKVGMVHARTQVVDRHGTPIGEYGRAFNLVDSLRRSQSGVAQPSTFVRAECVRVVGGLAEDLHMAMDWDLWNRLAMETSVSFVPETWSCFRRWQGSKTERDLSAFGPEQLTSVRRFYQQRTLPRELRAVRGEALAAAGVAAAASYCASGRFCDMRRAFLGALRNHPTAAVRLAGRNNTRYLAGRMLPGLSRLKQWMIARRRLFVDWAFGQTRRF